MLSLVNGGNLKLNVAVVLRCGTFSCTPIKLETDMQNEGEYSWFYKLVVSFLSQKRSTPKVLPGEVDELSQMTTVERA